jgi:hypothetical protein
VQDRQQQTLDAATGSPRILQALQERIAALHEDAEDVTGLLGYAPGSDRRFIRRAFQWLASVTRQWKIR